MLLACVPKCALRNVPRALFTVAFSVVGKLGKLLMIGSVK